MLFPLPRVKPAVPVRLPSFERARLRLLQEPEPCNACRITAFRGAAAESGRLPLGAGLR
jgi:hypothetical protein